MSGRNNQVSRIYAILNILESASNGLTVQELSDRVNDQGHASSKRTIYRDLEALNQAGFPLFEQENKTDTNSKRWLLERHKKISQYLMLSTRELVALFLARSALTPLRDTPFYSDLELAFNKIEEKLGTKNLQYFKNLESELKFEPGPKWGLGVEPDTLETIRAACAEGHLLYLLYESVNSRETRERKLGPHYMYFSKGAVYLVAEDLEDDQVKVFSITRMSNVRMDTETYKGSITDPNILFEHSLGIFRGIKPVKIKIDFSAKIAQFIKERNWHKTQRIVMHNNGTCTLSIEVAVTPELIQWILSYGTDATVLEPKEVRDIILHTANSLTAIYSKKAS